MTDEYQVNDYFNDEVDMAALAEIKQEIAEEEEARKAPAGQYVTVTPLTFKTDRQEMQLVDSYGDETPFKRPRYSCFSDAIHVETGKRFKISLDRSHVRLYVKFHGAGKPPTNHLGKVEGSETDSATRYMNR